jgi:hypothetical protein
MQETGWPLGLNFLAYLLCADNNVDDRIYGSE